MNVKKLLQTPALVKLTGNKLVSGSLVLFVAGMVTNLGNYLYHLSMGRMLGPVDYGALAALISLTYIFSVPGSALNLATTKYATSFKSIYKRLILLLGLTSLILLPIGVLTTGWLADFIKVQPAWLVFPTFIFACLGILVGVNFSLLQGYLRFGLVAGLGVLQIGFKLVLAVLLVYLGGRTASAFLSVLVGIGLVLALTIKPVLALPKSNNLDLSWRQLLVYAFPAFLLGLAFTSLYTSDILLAKRFLPDLEAGYYAALALLGKTIFFSVSPVSSVLFPMVARRLESGKPYRSLLKIAFLMVSAIC
ncbi:MAG: oligosaccharide flippase family protein, partial [Patescibacteria group bacterium]